MTNPHNQLIGFKVYEAQRSLHRSLEVALKPYDVTPGQWNLLNQLDRAGELSQREVADLTHKEQATITRYLDTLERKELVRRARHASDRRAYVISLTDKARALIATAQPDVLAVANDIIDGIGEADIDTFLTTLAKLKANAEASVSRH